MANGHESLRDDHRRTQRRLGEVLDSPATSEVVLIAVVIVAYWRRLAVDAVKEDEDVFLSHDF